MSCNRTTLRNLNLTNVEYEIGSNGLYINLAFTEFNPDGSVKVPDGKELSIEEIQNLLRYPIKIVNKKEDI